MGHRPIPHGCLAKNGITTIERIDSGTAPAEARSRFAWEGLAVPINAATVLATLNLDISKFTNGLDSAKAQIRAFTSDTATASEKLKAISAQLMNQ